MAPTFAGPQTLVRAVIFDAVSTLIHPDPPAPVIYAQIGRRFGSVLSPVIICERFVTAFQREENVDRALNLRTNEARESERWRNIVGKVLDDVTDREMCFAELFAHFARPESWRCDPDAEAVLRELAARGYPLGMASNYDARLRSVVHGLPALQPLRYLLISSEIGWRKPAPAFFSAITRALAAPAASILFVGDDSTNDHEGAQAGGMQAVLFDPWDRAQTVGVSTIRRLSDLLTYLPALESQ
jgi:putative hydrolase of the HAD superfamily